jgi:hypothetical protein
MRRILAPALIALVALLVPAFAATIQDIRNLGVQPTALVNSSGTPIDTINIGTVILDQTTPGTTNNVTNRDSFNVAATFTPAATSHTAGDVNGGAVQFTTACPSAGRIKINSVTLEIDGATIETTAWTLYLYSVTPPSATADDGAWDLPSGDRASFLGKIDIAQIVDLGSTLWIETHNIGKQIKCATANLFGYLVNGTTLTPQAVAHIVTLHTSAV